MVTGIEYDEIDDEFYAGNITAQRAAEMYVRYGGYTKEKANEKVTVLAFVKDHPDMEDISYDAVLNYNQHCAKLNVPARSFYDAWKHKNSLSGDVKGPMMQYINGLDLTRAQKDGLYYALGWKESRIHEAPWH